MQLGGVAFNVFILPPIPPILVKGATPPRISGLVGSPVAKKELRAAAVREARPEVR